MHVALVIDEFWPTAGGIGTYYTMLSCLLSDAGHAVTIVLDDRHGEPVLPCTKNVELVRLRSDVGEWEQRLGDLLPDEAMYARRDLAFGIAARAWYQSTGCARQIDVLEIADTKGYGLALIDHDLPPVALTLHGSKTLLSRHQGTAQGIPLNLDTRIQIACELNVMGLADSLMACSPSNADAWSTLSERPVRLVTPPWHDLGGHYLPPKPADKASTASGTKLRGLVLGRLEMLKGALNVAEACRLLQQRNHPAEIHWLGRSNPSAPGGEDMATYLYKRYADVWGSSLHWHGRQGRDEVARQLQQADYLLVASNWETLNLTVFEAMTTGTPVIVSDGAGVSAFCEHEVHALCVPAGQADALADAIERLTGDAELRQRLISGAAQMLAERLHPDKIVAERISAYEAAIARRAARRQLVDSFSPSRPLLEQALRSLAESEYVAIEKMSFGRFLYKLAGKAKRAVLRRASARSGEKMRPVCR